MNNARIELSKVGRTWCIRVERRISPKEMEYKQFTADTEEGFYKMFSTKEVLDAIKWAGDNHA